MSASQSIQAISDAQRQALSAHWRGPVQWDVDMAPHCTLRAGGRADALIEAATVDDLRRLIPWLRDNTIPWRVIGRGSNILVNGSGFHGVILRLIRNLSRIYPAVRHSGQDGAVLVRASAGCPLARLTSWAGKQGCNGLEFLTGIPGSVGGAVRMNAGAFGREIKDCLASLEILDLSGRLHRLGSKDLLPAYRVMNFRDSSLAGGVITAAGFLLHLDAPAAVTERNRLYLLRRREKQPTRVASAGSFFKNPAGDSAGRLIDAAGLKGLRCGGAMISPKHANFLVNAGGATAEEILALMREVQQRVFDCSGVMLEPEVHVL